MPAPPVASMVRFAQTTVTPAVDEGQAADGGGRRRRRSGGRARRPFSTTAMFSCSRTVRTSVFDSSRPVASPNACRMRAAECPASRPKARSYGLPGAASLSKFAPQPAARARGPGLLRRRAGRRPRRTGHAPTSMVSATWASIESSGESTAAMPPWAYQVLLSATVSFASRMTSRPASAAAMAARRPATPPPMTSTSHCRCGKPAGLEGHEIPPAGQRVCHNRTLRPVLLGGYGRLSEVGST